MDGHYLGRHYYGHLAIIPGGKLPLLPGRGKPPDSIEQEAKPPVQWKVVLKNGFNVSWKLASAVIHDYVNFENWVSRKPTSRWSKDFILHTFHVQYKPRRPAKAQVFIVWGIPVATSWIWEISGKNRMTFGRWQAPWPPREKKVLGKTKILFFTSSKNIIPSRSYRTLKIAYILRLACSPLY